MKSLSEIETTVKRASKAAGFSWGVSEEIGKSIRLLELFSLPGIKYLNSYYKDKKKKIFENLSLVKEKNLPSSSHYCPVLLGISFLDQIKKIENYKKIHFSSVAYPILFLPFLSRCSEIIGKKIQFEFDKKKILLNLNVNIYANFIDQEFPKYANNIEIRFLKNKDSFTDEEWNSLYKLSENTFVDETDSLKEGAAGAGLTDND
jgi:hypothetical protein